MNKLIPVNMIESRIFFIKGFKTIIDRLRNLYFN